MDDNTTVTAFMALFRGRTNAWGSVKGMANKESVTKEHYRKHLDAKVSLGVYPLLDDGTCHFFVIDLDEKVWKKALAIRQKFHDLGVHVYIALSKSKGYHIWCFPEKPVQAKTARALCHGILANLGLVCEVFPKQDKLDEVTPLGSYINIPCFGGLSTIYQRQFLDKEQKIIPFKDALERIERAPNQTIEDAAQQVPMPLGPFRYLPTPPPVIFQKKGGRPRKSNNPPCIDKILKGVSQPGRDEAAFALARHYLDQNYSEPEVLAVLQRWDTNNRPPFNDPGLLETKVRSACKGYTFGCSSIQGNPNLSSFCCGEENCFWLKAQKEEKKKRGLIRELSFHETETHLYEQVKEGFACFEKATKTVTYVKKIEYPDFTIVPLQVVSETTEEVVAFPTEAAEYGDTVKLKNGIREYISYYVDLEEQDLEYCSWYVIGTWVYDRLHTVAYLRFLGDTGCGKSRGLDVIGRLCYKSLIMAGAVTPAPIYREIRKFRGTIILEEADFKESTEKGEVITILNCGIEKGRPVLRCSGDDNNVIEVLPTFGPKVFATRMPFEDKALESRCYTCIMRETWRNEIPFEIWSDLYYEDWIMELRNKLLLWRFHNFDRIAKKFKPPDFGYIEPRLKQMGLPLAIPFMHLPEVMDDFREFLQKRQRELIQEREESETGIVLRAFLEVARDNNKWVSAGKMADHISNDRYIITGQRISRILKTLAIKRTATKLRQPGENSPYYFYIWDASLMKNLLKRYVLEPEEFQELFQDIPDMAV